MPPSTEARTVKATHPTRGASSLTGLAIAQSSVDIVLVATGAIDGTAPGHDISYAIATLSDDPRAPYYGDVDALGRFSFPALPPGEYDVDVLGRSRIPTSKVTVIAGKTATAVFAAPAP